MNSSLNFKYIKVCIFLGIVNAMGDRINQVNCELKSEGVVEFAGSIRTIQVNLFSQCAFSCLRIDKCVTFFYNIHTNQCVLHSKDFLYQRPSVSESGWKYFTISDITGRCPTPYLYYRHLDFCYTVDGIPKINYPDIKQICTIKNGKLAAVKSEQRQEYIEHVLSGRPFNYGRICIAEMILADGSLVLDDGTIQAYSNWAEGEPTKPEHECIRLSRDGLWYDLSCTQLNNIACVFVCEKE